VIEWYMFSLQAKRQAINTTYSEVQYHQVYCTALLHGVPPPLRPALLNKSAPWGIGYTTAVLRCSIHLLPLCSNDSAAYYPTTSSTTFSMVLRRGPDMIPILTAATKQQAILHYLTLIPLLAVTTVECDTPRFANRCNLQCRSRGTDMEQMHIK